MSEARQQAPGPTVRVGAEEIDFDELDARIALWYRLAAGAQFAVFVLGLACLGAVFAAALTDRSALLWAPPLLIAALALAWLGAGCPRLHESSAWVMARIGRPLPDYVLARQRQLERTLGRSWV